MSDERASLRGAVVDAIGDRQLVWFGTRGDDVESVADIPQLDASISLISAYRRRPLTTTSSLEDLTGVRVDLDSFDVDDHPRAPAVRALRDDLHRVLSRPSVAFTYRPTMLMEGVALSRAPRTRLVGLPVGHRASFDFKPWVESRIYELGVPSVPWRHVADLDQLDVLPLLARGPVVLRRSRTTGGVGIVRVDAKDSLEAAWPEQDEAFVSVAPFLDGLPVNVGAVVWSDGVSIHPASVQLIGIPSLTNRGFGYAGNDFGAARDLGDDVLGSIDASVTVIGHWLRTVGYLGAFGVDFLLTDQGPLFMEVNPRFQGSTHASCQLSVEANWPCLLLEHLAATFGLEVPRPVRSLPSVMADVDAFAHLVVHNTSSLPLHIDPTDLVRRFEALDGHVRSDVLTNPDLITMPEATVGRFTVRAPLTQSGFDLDDVRRTILEEEQGAWAALSPATPPSASPTLRSERSGTIGVRR